MSPFSEQNMARFLKSLFSWTSSKNTEINEPKDIPPVFVQSFPMQPTKSIFVETPLGKQYLSKGVQVGESFRKFVNVQVGGDHVSLANQEQVSLFNPSLGNIQSSAPSFAPKLKDDIPVKPSILPKEEIKTGGIGLSFKKENEEGEKPKIGGLGLLGAKKDGEIEKPKLGLNLSGSKKEGEESEKPKIGGLNLLGSKKEGEEGEKPKIGGLNLSGLKKEGEEGEKPKIGGLGLLGTKKDGETEKPKLGLNLSGTKKEGEEVEKPKIGGLNLLGLKKEGETEKPKLGLNLLGAKKDGETEKPKLGLNLSAPKKEGEEGEKPKPSGLNLPEPKKDGEVEEKPKATGLSLLGAMKELDEGRRPALSLLGAKKELDEEGKSKLGGLNLLGSKKEVVEENKPKPTGLISLMSKKIPEQGEQVAITVTSSEPKATEQPPTAEKPVSIPEIPRKADSDSPKSIPALPNRLTEGSKPSFTLPKPPQSQGTQEKQSWGVYPASGSGWGVPQNMNRNTPAAGWGKTEGVSGWPKPETSIRTSGWGSTPGVSGDSGLTDAQKKQMIRAQVPRMN